MKNLKFCFLFLVAVFFTVAYIVVAPHFHTLDSSRICSWLGTFVSCASICALWFKWADPGSPMRVLPFIVIVAMITYELKLVGLETTREGILAHGLSAIMWMANIVFGIVILAEPKGTRHVHNQVSAAN